MKYVKQRNDRPHVIALSDLNPAGLNLTRLTNSQLVTFIVTATIVTATEVQVQRGRLE